ncbi:hypothetical protein HD806DRAFT_532165 [Xylariaceae sp. AK1471]|nr:hypothetical protein HD806DRAFT_532165 [Xylariaceae sp. AK1471]
MATGTSGILMCLGPSGPLSSSSLDFRTSSTVNLILLWGVLVMRGSACTWDDTVDIDFDRKVSRCRNRPLERGAISMTQANSFTAAQSLISFATMTLHPCSPKQSPTTPRSYWDSPWPGAFTWERSFYVANVAWTLLYDLVHSHQDAAEDTKAGVKNLVLLYANPDGATPEERFGTMPLLR